MICPQCHHDNRISDHYCEKCGCNLDAYRTPPEPPVPNPPDSSHSKIILAACLGALLVILSVFAGFFIGRTNNQNNTGGAVAKENEVALDNDWNYHPADSDYSIVSATTVAAKPRGDAMNQLSSGAVHRISQLATLDDGQEIWGKTEDGWILIKDSGGVYGEEITLSPSSRFTGDSYQAVKDLDLYLSPSLTVSSAGKLPAGTELYIDDEQSDSTGTVWGKVADAWLILKDSSSDYVKSIDHSSDSDTQNNSEVDSGNKNTASADPKEDSDTGDTASQQVPVVIQKDVFIFQDNQDPASSKQPDANYYDQYIPDDPGVATAPQPSVPAAPSPYLLPGVNSTYLSRSDIDWMSQSTLELARNEIYARHGRRFVTDYIQAYFDQQSWYSGTVPADVFDESVFNVYEKANLDMIVNYEIEKGWRAN